MHMTSIWDTTAAPGTATPALAEAVSADVAIVGAGYTGLTAALRLGERGVKVVVLDAVGPGAGASGRNGGQLIPGLKYDPNDLATIYGEAAVDFVGRAPDLVFDVVERHNISCDASRNGWIQASIKHSHLGALEGRAEQWARRGAPVEVLRREEISRKIGSETFVGGWIDRRGGCLHPLKYVYGLVRAALSKGVQIHGSSRVVRLGKSGPRWILATQTGATITAEDVVIATNGCTDDLWPNLKKTIVAANSFQIATAALDAHARLRILPGGSVVSDSRRIANYFRIGPEGRLLMGGRGSFAEPHTAAGFSFLQKAIKQIFPTVSDLEVEYGWAGRIALTRDFLPHLHQPFPNLTIALGCQGRGVALASAMGMAIGEHLFRSQKLSTAETHGRKALPLPCFSPSIRSSDDLLLPNA